jgi:hypothetical protein
MQPFGLTKYAKTKQLTTKCFGIKINENNRQNRNTRIAASRYRTNKEIKFLYYKKKINELLYKIHLYIYIYMYIYIYTHTHIYIHTYFNCNWVETRWQQYSTHLHTNNTHNTENGTYITIKRNKFGKCRPCPIFASYTLAFALQLRKSTENPQLGQKKSAPIYRWQ